MGKDLCPEVLESITFFTDHELIEMGVEADLLEAPGYVKVKGGILERKEYFDAVFFNYTPNEALIMDPQVRIFHECVWNALEDAGYAGYVPGISREKIGLYAGASSNFYWRARAAIHFACQGLLNGECHLAIAGGVSIWGHEIRGYVYQEGMINSRDGHCRAFDADASGTVPGEGAGAVVLKPLEEALKDGDFIHAVIRGTAVNNDGTRKVGYTAPSIIGQAEVIRLALRAAEVHPETIGYVEAHGTGTIVGDPIEFEGLKLAFNFSKRGFCGIGSLKTNIGHLDAAVGVAWFIKTVLALKHKQIPPSLHYKTPNPKMDSENSPFYVVTQLTPWKRYGHPLRAGVSSFGN